MENEYKLNRTAKLNNWVKFQGELPDKFARNFNCEQVLNAEIETFVAVAGRIMLKRFMGKIAFFNLQDFSGNIQLVMKHENMSEFFEFVEANLDIGDIVGVQGTVFLTQKGEKSINIMKLELLTKSLLPLPEKQAGLVDEELKLRKRYLDLLVNKESKERFVQRYKIISFIKQFLLKYEFIEVETPMLQAKASGALANPFKTYHDALDIPLFLRIAPETYLKRLMAGGYERVFELGKSFRNEGIDPSHLQEFTMLEFYTAYWNYEDALNFTQELLKQLFEFLGIEQFTYMENTINLKFPFKVMTYKDLFFEYTKLNLEELLKNPSKIFEILGQFVDLRECKSVGRAIDMVYKKHCRPKLVDPVFITHQPAILGPLARMNKNEIWSDRFQLVINGWEVVNSYSELVDPFKQEKILQEQQELAKNGEDEVMLMEDDFIEAMEYGMPPMAGVGIGLDRLIALITNAKTLRDVVFFPTLK